MDDITIEKIKIANATYSSEMLLTCNPYQVEEKYGGKASNALNYWPPVVPDSSFLMPGQKSLLSDRDSYELFNHDDESLQIDQTSPESRVLMKSRSRISSLEINLNHSEISLENLENDLFCRSDAEDQKENLIDFVESSPYNNFGEKSPEKLKTGMPSLEEFFKNSEKQVLLEQNSNKKEVTPCKRGVLNNRLQDFETPKKNGPKPIGLIMEKDDRWAQCSKLGCCQNIENSCTIV